MSEFHVGAQVVCTYKGAWSDPRWDAAIHRPTYGQIYTVRDITPPEYYANGAPPSIWLEEIVNPPVMWTTGIWEIAFPTRIFRPIRKTSIDVFTKLLEPTQKEKKVEVA